eukprot:2730562-Amphidinium_carterae.1
MLQTWDMFKMFNVWGTYGKVLWLNCQNGKVLYTGEMFKMFKAVSKRWCFKLGKCSKCSNVQYLGRLLAKSSG